MEEKRHANESHLFLTAKVVTDDTFSRHEGFDLAAVGRDLPLSDLQTFRVLKQMAYSVLKSRVAQHFNYPESRFRLWGLATRRNQTARPDLPVTECEPSISTMCEPRAVYF